MTAKRHHYLPAAYQEAWGTGTRKRRLSIGLFDKQTAEFAVRPILNTAVEGHRYSLPSDSTRPRDSVEQALQRSEDLALPILREFRERVPESLTAEQVEVLTWYAAIMYGRVPQASDQAQVLGEAVASRLLEASLDSPSEELVRAFEEKTGEKPDLAGMREAMLRGGVRVGMTDTGAVMAALRMADRVFPHFQRLSWRLLRAADGEEFITSDAPVCVCAVQGKQLILGGGLGLPGGAVYFPLSPSVCLFGDRSPDLRTTVVSRQRREDLDWRQAIGAKRFVLFREKTGDVEATIQRMLDGPQPKRAQAEIDDLVSRHAAKFKP